jgi:hypothetical protein
MLDLTSAPAKRLHQNWESWRRGRLFPARSDFDPLDLRYIVGHLSLVDVTYDPLRFRYRLHGSHTADWLGYEMTGKEIDDSPGPEASNLIRHHFTMAVEQRMPIAWRRQFMRTDNRTLNHEALILPLARDGATIDMLMAAVVPL